MTVHPELSADAPPADACAEDLLDAVCAQRAAEAAAARETLRLVVAWAARHRVAGLPDLDGGEVYADHEVELAGPGAPGVSQFAVVELAAALGMTPRSAKSYLGDALELAHRLPLLHARVLAGDLPTWRARGIAQRTKQLSAEAAAWVDARLAPVVHGIGPARIQRLVEQAITLFDAEAESQDIEFLHSDLHVTVMPMGAGSGGGGVGLGDLARLEALLPLPDALALDAALCAAAHDLRATRPDLGLETRRALALGQLADASLTAATGRSLSLTVHLGQPDLAGHHLATVRTTTGAEHTVTTEAVATWCHAPGTRLSLRTIADPDVLAEAGRHRLAGPAFTPATTGRKLLEQIPGWARPPRQSRPRPARAAAVGETGETAPRLTRRASVDLTGSVTCQGYAPSPHLREQVMMLSPTCAFPHCTVPAERCDLDHIRAWLAGGATTTLNLAPLCRLHHRAKTHGGWTYHQPTYGTYRWTSPTGRRYRRTRHGTTETEKGDGHEPATDAVSLSDCWGERHRVER